METIFDKPLDKQVASNTQAIANLEPVSIIDKLSITNTNFELYSESGIYLVSHLVVMNIYLHIKNSMTMQAGSAVIGGIANGYRPAHTIRVPAIIDGLNKQGSFDVKANGDISIGISENMSFTSSCYIRLPSVVYKLN